MVGLLTGELRAREGQSDNKGEGVSALGLQSCQERAQN